MRFLLLTLATVITLVSACSPDQQKGGNPSEPETDVFAKGADISWVTKMESEGMKFYNSAGKETDCFKLIKDIGFEAIRLRVWVDPADGWCNKADVVNKAIRAKNLGMMVMIDFHYSDVWADPGQQNTPAAWKQHNADQMTAAIRSHTTDILQTLKNNDVDVKWVQVGNEVNQGMLHPSGYVNGNSTGSFIKYFNTGHDAVKEIYPEAKVILHISNGHDLGLFTWFFDLMKNGGAHYDVIGMSLYPTWWDSNINGWTSDWQTNSTKCINNMKSLISKYGKPVMLCEVGMPCSQPEMSKAALQYILEQAKAISQCLGVFYWEPEAPDGYNGGYGMGAFQNGRPTIALDPFAK